MKKVLVNLVLALSYALLFPLGTSAQTAPLFLTQLEDVSANDGDSITVNVVVDTSWTTEKTEIAGYVFDTNVPAGVSWKLKLKSRTLSPVSVATSAINLRVNASLVFGPLTSADEGSIALEATNVFGSTTSEVRQLTVAPVGPTIVSHPASKTVISGSKLTLMVRAAGTSPLKYQWYKDGKLLAGATKAELVVTSAGNPDAGEYAVDVSNAIAAVKSDVAVVKVVSAEKADIVSGLVLRFRFDGAVEDSSVSEYTPFSTAGDISYVADRFGKAKGAIKFGKLSKKGPFVSGDGPDLANRSSSISFWVKKNYDGDGSNGGWIFSLGGGIEMAGTVMHVAMDYGQSIRYAFFYNQIDTNWPLVRGQWYHVACTFNHKTKKRCIYVDGDLVQEDVAEFPFTGKRFLSLTPAKMSLDDFRLYNRELSAVDVAALASSVTYATNRPPVISSIGDVKVAEDKTTPLLAFTIYDEETPSSKLKVSAKSSNTKLVPDSRIKLSGKGTKRSLRITPAKDQSGSAVITVQVDDGTHRVKRTFKVKVKAVNDAPTITKMANQTIRVNKATAKLPFRVADVETPASKLKVSVKSSKPSLIPESRIVLSGKGENRTIKLTPERNKTGTAKITLTVSDGDRKSKRTFRVKVEKRK